MNKLPQSNTIEVSRRFIRMRQQRSDGFVEFDFAIGDPELSVELILPRAAFEVFKQQPGMEEISDAESSRVHQKLQNYLFGQS